VDNVLENTDLDAGIEDLKMAYGVVFTGSPEADLYIGLIGSLTKYRVAVLGGEQSTSPDRQANLLLIIKKLRADAPYSDLPEGDRRPLLNIKNRLETAAVPPDVASPVLSDLAGVIACKNNDLQKGLDESRAAGRRARIYGIVAFLSLFILLIQPISR
jgi:hypothetical protein